MRKSHFIKPFLEEHSSHSNNLIKLPTDLHLKNIKLNLI